MRRCELTKQDYKDALLTNLAHAARGLGRSLVDTPEYINHYMDAVERLVILANTPVRESFFSIETKNDSD